MTAPWGLYVHVPTCRIRCPYCAFHVVPDRGFPAERYVDAVLAERQARRDVFPGTPTTLYLGGGTPSRLPAAALSRLLAGLDATAVPDVTCEANPEDVDEAWLDAALAAGVTRVSLGVQTWHDGHARRLGRARTPDAARLATARLADAVAHGRLRSWSVDLMFGLHDQTLAQLDADLDEVLACGAPHVSLYGLTVEDDTGYARAAARGTLTPAEDDTWRDMYGRIVSRLRGAGIERYEVSNFARTGHQARHNRGYWEARPYLGLGPSAHGLDPDGTRHANVADTDAWLASPAGVRTSESPTPRERAVDLLVSSLRGVPGVSLHDLAADTGHAPTPAARARLVAAGVLTESDGRMTLTDDGFYVTDAVVRTLVDALTPVDRTGSTR